jgi:hypothetical protein
MKKGKEDGSVPINIGNLIDETGYTFGITQNSIHGWSLLH